MFPRSGYREELREQERKARAKMQSLNGDFEAPSPYPGSPLFDEPIKANEEDELTRRIRDSLGDFRAVEQQVNSNYSAGLIGVDQMPATPCAPEPIHDPDAEPTPEPQPAVQEMPRRFYDSGGPGPVREPVFAIPRHRPMPPPRSTMGPPAPPSTTRPFAQPFPPPSQSHPPPYSSQSTGSSRFPPPRGYPERLNGFVQPEPRHTMPSRRPQSSHQVALGMTQNKRPRQSPATSHGDDTADERAINDILSEMKELPSTPLTGIAPTPMRSPPAPLPDFAFLEPPVTPLPSFMMTPHHPADDVAMPSPPRPPTLPVPVPAPPIRIPSPEQPNKLPESRKAEIRMNSVNLGLSEESEDSDSNIRDGVEDVGKSRHQEPVFKASSSFSQPASIVDRSPVRASVVERGLTDLLLGTERPAMDHDDQGNEVQTLRLSQSWSLRAFLEDDSKLTGDKSTPASDTSPRGIPTLPMLSPIPSPVSVPQRGRRGATPRRGRRGGAAATSLKAAEDGSSAVGASSKPTPSPRRSRRISTDSPFSSPALNHERVKRKQRRTRGALNKTAIRRNVGSVSGRGDEGSSENEDRDQEGGSRERTVSEVVQKPAGRRGDDEEDEEVEEETQRERLLQRRRRVPSASVTPVLSAKRRLEVSRTESDEEPDAGPGASPPPLVLNTRRVTRQSSGTGPSVRPRISATPPVQGRAGGMSSPWNQPLGTSASRRDETVASKKRGSGGVALSSPSGGGSSDGYPGAPGSERNIAVSASSSSTSSDESKLGQAKMSQIVKLFRSRVQRERSDSRNTARPDENENVDAKSSRTSSADASRARVPSPSSSSDGEDNRSRRRKRMTKKRVEVAVVPTETKARSRSRMRHRPDSMLGASDSDNGSSNEATGKSGKVRNNGRSKVTTKGRTISSNSDSKSEAESITAEKAVSPVDVAAPPSLESVSSPTAKDVQVNNIAVADHHASLSPISTTTEKSEKSESSEEGEIGTKEKTKPPEMVVVPPLPTSPLSPLSSSSDSDSDSSSSSSSSSESSSSASSSASSSDSSKSHVSSDEGGEEAAKKPEEADGGLKKRKEAELNDVGARKKLTEPREEVVSPPRTVACAKEEVIVAVRTASDEKVCDDDNDDDDDDEDIVDVIPRQRRPVVTRRKKPSTRRAELKFAAGDDSSDGEVQDEGKKALGRKRPRVEGNRNIRRKISVADEREEEGDEGVTRQAVGNGSTRRRGSFRRSGSREAVPVRRSTRKRTITGATSSTVTTTTTHGSADSASESELAQVKNRRKTRKVEKKKKNVRGVTPVAVSPKGRQNTGKNAGSEHQMRDSVGKVSPARATALKSIFPAGRGDEPARAASRADSQSSVRIISDVEDQQETGAVNTSLKRKRTPALSVEPKRRRGGDVFPSAFENAARAVSASPRLAPTMAVSMDAPAMVALAHPAYGPAGAVRPRAEPGAKQSPQSMMTTTSATTTPESTTRTSIATVTAVPAPAPATASPSSAAMTTRAMSSGPATTSSTRNWIRLASLMMPPSELESISREAVSERPLNVEKRVLSVPGSVSQFSVAYMTIFDYRVPDFRSSIPIRALRRPPRPPSDVWVEEKVVSGRVEPSNKADPVNEFLRRDMAGEELARCRLQAHWDFQKLLIRASDEQKRLDTRYELGLDKRRPSAHPWDHQQLAGSVTSMGSVVGGPTGHSVSLAQSLLSSMPSRIPLAPATGPLRLLQQQQLQLQLQQNRRLVLPTCTVLHQLGGNQFPLLQHQMGGGGGSGVVIICVNGHLESVTNADLQRVQGIVRLLWISVDLSRIRFRRRSLFAVGSGDLLNLPSVLAPSRDWLLSSSSNHQDSRWLPAARLSTHVFQSDVVRHLERNDTTRVSSSNASVAGSMLRENVDEQEQEQQQQQQQQQQLQQLQQVSESEKKVFDAEGRQTSHFRLEGEEQGRQGEDNAADAEEERSEDEGEVDTKPLQTPVRLPPYEVLRRGSGSHLLVPSSFAAGRSPNLPNASFSSLDEAGSRGDFLGGSSSSPAIHDRRVRSRSRSEDWDPLCAKYAPGSLIVPPPRPRLFGYFEMKRLREMTHSWEPTTEEDANAKTCMFLSEAKRLKFLADAQKDRNRQAMTYLEAVMYFILTAFTMEKMPGTEKAAYKMYQDTLGLIESGSISGQASNRLCPGKTPATGTLDPRLSIICIRCRSLLNIKLFQMRRAEANDLIPVVDDHFSKTPMADSVSALCKTASLLCSSGSSPLSPNPSPASSVGSASSGYSSANGIGPHGDSSAAPNGSGGSRWTYNDANASFTMVISATAQYGLLQLQNVVKAVVQGHNLWDQADEMVDKENATAFFTDLEEVVGPLTIHSTIKELVYFVQAGLRLMQTRLIEELSLGSGGVGPSS